MSEREIWKYFCDNKISHSKPFDRDFIWVTKESFSKMEKHFLKEINFLHSGASFRSRGYIFHLHAVEQKDCVFVHKDFGNLARFLPLGLFHLFVDVIPYLIFVRVKKTSLQSLFERPQ